MRGIPVHWGDRLGHVLGGDHGIFLPGLPAEAFQFQLPAEVGLGVSVLGGFLVVLAGNGVVPFPGGGLYPPLQGLELRRGLQGLQPGLGGRLVQQVDGLVGQAPVREIPHRERDGGLQGGRFKGQAMVVAVAGGEGVQNLQGGLLAGLLHPNRLEPPLQGGVFFSMNRRYSSVVVAPMS